MKKYTILSGLILIMVLAVLTFAGCSDDDPTESVEATGPDNTTETANQNTTTEFTRSKGIDDNGFWENITALDHVKLCDYEGILIPGDVHEITDEAVQAQIDGILAGYTAEEEVTDRAVKDGDTVNIDYVGSVDGVEFDMVVVNLYPFQETVSKAGVTLENARGNIDIGGPCMLRAAAKNFLRVIPLCDPADYGEVLGELKRSGGEISLSTRYEAAKKAFAHTAGYDAAITSYLRSQCGEELKAIYEIT